MRVATWNINSLRSRADQVAEWIDRHRPDVLVLQETKCNAEQFREFVSPVFADRGYEVAHHGNNHWNGVAIASRVGLQALQRGFTGPQQPPYDEPRLIAALCGPDEDPIRVATVYVPNGRALDDPHYLYKLVWLERLRSEAMVGRWAGSSTVICGDFNVAPADQDIYDPRRFRGKTHASPPERAGIAALLDAGFVDAARTLHPDTPEFTWWNYRQQVVADPGPEPVAGRVGDRGLRLDLALVSEPLWPRVEACWVDRPARTADRPSDHAPLVVDIGAGGGH